MRVVHFMLGVWAVLLVLGCAEMQKVGGSDFAGAAARAVAKKAVSGQLAAVLEKAGIPYNDKWDEAVGHALEQKWPAAKTSLAQAALASSLDGKVGAEVGVALTLASKVPGLPGTAARTLAFLGDALAAIPGEALVNSEGRGASRPSGKPGVTAGPEYGDLAATVAPCDFVKLDDPLMVEPETIELMSQAGKHKGAIRFASAGGGVEFEVGTGTQTFTTPEVLEFRAFEVVPFAALAAGYLPVVGRVMVLPDQVRVVSLPVHARQALIVVNGDKEGLPIVVNGRYRGTTPTSFCVAPGLYNLGSPSGKVALNLTVQDGDRIVVDTSQFHVASQTVDDVEVATEAAASGDVGETDSADQPRLTAEGKPEQASTDVSTTLTDLVLVHVSAGSFQMGSPDSEPGRDYDEFLHQVVITRDFLMGRTEVTIGQWTKLMLNRPESHSECGDACPVVGVNWYDAVAFANELSQREGLPQCYTLSDCEGKPGKDFGCDSVSFAGLDCKGYRLPTEAEWEYAARAGTDSTFSTGECLATTEANFDGDYPQLDCPGGEDRGRPIDVASFPPNAWGAYDMQGNVWEWAWDLKGGYPDDSVADPLGPVEGDGHITRGGSWDYGARSCRPGNRGADRPGRGRDNTGFRLARTL